MGSYDQFIKETIREQSREQIERQVKKSIWVTSVSYTHLTLPTNREV